MLTASEKVPTNGRANRRWNWSGPLNKWSIQPINKLWLAAAVLLLLLLTTTTSCLLHWNTTTTTSPGLFGFGFSFDMDDIGSSTTGSDVETGDNDRHAAGRSQNPAALLVEEEERAVLDIGSGRAVHSGEQLRNADILDSNPNDDDTDRRPVSDMGTDRPTFNANCNGNTNGANANGNASANASGNASASANANATGVGIRIRNFTKEYTERSWVPLSRLSDVAKSTSIPSGLALVASATSAAHLASQALPWPPTNFAQRGSLRARRMVAGTAGLMLSQAKSVRGASLPTTLPTDTTSIDYRDEDYTGTIPSQFGLLINLEDISLEGLSLTGSLPTEIGQWQSLTGCDFRNMDITGSLPSELGEILATEDVYLGESSLRGALPSQFGKWESASSNMYFRYASFSGELPTELGRLVQMASGMFQQVRGQTRSHGTSHQPMAALPRPVALTAVRHFATRRWRRLPARGACWLLLPARRWRRLPARRWRRLPAPLKRHQVQQSLWHRQ